jgi:hypothetical protein
MKVGDRVGILCHDKIDLYCSIESFGKDGINMWVINGAWDLTICYTGGGIVHAPQGDKFYRDMSIGFTGNIPREIAGDYNAAIDYMNTQVHSSWWKRHTTNLTLGIRVKWTLFWKGIRAGYKAFNLARSSEENMTISYRDNDSESDNIVPLDGRFADFDDDIPF